MRRRLERGGVVDLVDQEREAADGSRESDSAFVGGGSGRVVVLVVVVARRRDGAVPATVDTSAGSSSGQSRLEALPTPSREAAEASAMARAVESFGSRSRSRAGSRPERTAAFSSAGSWCFFFFVRECCVCERGRERRRRIGISGEWVAVRKSACRGVGVERRREERVVRRDRSKSETVSSFEKKLPLSLSLSFSLPLTSGALKFSVSSLQCGLMTTFFR